MLGRGDEAPEFKLPADDGSSVGLSDFRGRKVLVYFYPKDDTPGCTAQACALRDDLARFDRADVSVLGISTDPVESHERFRDKYDLNFPLLADEKHEVAEAYGVWQKKKLFGRESMGVVRSTFLVDEEGRIEEAWRDVNARKHLDIVTGYLDI